MKKKRKIPLSPLSISPSMKEDLAEEQAKDDSHILDHLLDDEDDLASMFSHWDEDLEDSND